MDAMTMNGLPWFGQPVMLQSPRTQQPCDLTPEQCAYQSHWWRNWYQADRAYGLSAVYFFVAVIALFTLLRVVARLASRHSVARTGPWQKSLAASRYLAYRGFRIGGLGWYSPSLGVIVLGLLGLVFFVGLTFGPKPYYWPKIPNGSFGDSQPIATRTDWMTVGILPFLIMAASKLNLITQLTGVSHERLQVFHRWMAYAMFVLALIHTFPFIVTNIQEGTMVEQWNTSVNYWTGVIALLAQAFLTFFSVKAFRDRFYEFFKATHLLAVIVFVVFFFLHCEFVLTSWLFFIATGAAYFAPFLCVQLRTFYEYGCGLRASLAFENDDTVTVRIPLQSWWEPGQHMFLRFVSARMGLHVLTAHPFTVCSLPESGEAVFHIRVRNGITRRLASVAQAHPYARIPVWLDGPYGGMQEEQLVNYDRQLIIAGGSGAGFTLPVIERILQQRRRSAPNRSTDDKLPLSELGTSGKLSVVLVTRRQETGQWFRGQMSRLLAQYASGLDELRVDVRIHVTRGSRALSPAQSSSDLEDTEVQTFRADKLDVGAQSPASEDSVPGVALRIGRPDLKAIVREATNSGSGASVGIAVCGPSSMMHDVRNAAADAELRTLLGHKGAPAVYLHTECFGW